MHQGWLLIGLSLSYLGLLFLIAYVADKNKRRRLQGQPLLYSLSLAVYCTSWTFFGTVGQASESPWSPVPIYLGPMLVFLFGWRLLARLILVAKREHITSIADFIAARYGKSQRLAMVIALIAIMGILPYLVLQLKAIVTGLDLLMANPVPAGPTGNTAGLALGVALLLALFSILFGTRHRMPPSTTAAWWWPSPSNPWSSCSPSWRWGASRSGSSSASRARPAP